MTIDKKFEKAKKDIENNRIICFFYRDEGSDWIPFYGELRKGNGDFIERLIINQFTYLKLHDIRISPVQLIGDFYLEIYNGQYLYQRRVFQYGSRF